MSSYLYREEVITDLWKHLPLGGRGQCSDDEAIVMSPSKRKLSDQTSHALQTLLKVTPRLPDRILNTMINTLTKINGLCQ